MSLFGTIMNKIFHHDAPPAAPAAQAAPAPAAAAPAPAAAPEPATPAQPVDVEAVLEKMADDKGDAGNWRTSIVDLLKLLDMDSSMSARHELASELDVHVGADGTAEENEALIKAVWKELADHGGQVPASLHG